MPSLVLTITDNASNLFRIDLYLNDPLLTYLGTWILFLGAQHQHQ